MRDWAAVRDRYLRDRLSVRLGGLAANLARMSSFSDHPGHRNVTEGLLEESKFFIEWTVSEAPMELQERLVELQVQLARWQRSWPDIWMESARRAKVANEALAWSERILASSGLLQQE